LHEAAKILFCSPGATMLGLATIGKDSLHWLATEQASALRAEVAYRA